jgi:hypothetical protein
VVPVDSLQRYAEVAKRHDEVHSEVLPDVGHYELIVPAGSAWDALRRVLRALIRPSET